MNIARINYRRFEISAVLVTGLMKFLVLDILEAKFWFILISGGLWILYISFSVFYNRSVLDEWGIGMSGFRQTFKILSIPTAIVFIVSAWYGLSQEILIFNLHILPVVLLYPLWGIVQQLLIISLFGSNIYSLQISWMRFPIVVTLTSVLFSVVHFPSIPLMVVTFFLALFYCLIFFRLRNILALGLFHGWLACVFYFFVLGRDPWLEFISSI